MKPMMRSSPWLFLRLDMTNGRSPRIRRASASIFSSDAPTCGARSILLMTKIGSGDSGPTLGRDFVAGCHVDDVDRQIGQLRREGRSQVVAAGFDQYQVEIREFCAHVGDRREIHRSVFADRGMRAAAGFDAGNAVWRQRPRA